MNPDVYFQNGGTCVDGVNEYTCKCPTEYSGKFCEIEPMVAHMYQQASPCAHHDCKHGICFQPPGRNDYICKCAPGYSGNVLNQLCIEFAAGNFLPENSWPGKFSRSRNFLWHSRKFPGILIFFPKNCSQRHNSSRNAIKISSV